MAAKRRAQQGSSSNNPNKKRAVGTASAPEAEERSINDVGSPESDSDVKMPYKSGRGTLGGPHEISGDEETDIELNQEEMAAFREQGEELEHLVGKYTLKTYQKDTSAYHRPDPASHYFGHRDMSGLELRLDHADRPLWIDAEKGSIIIESFSPAFKEAEKILINIAEPLSRVALIHEYTITPHSLIAAVAVGYSSQSIIESLDFLSKTALPDSIKEFIINSTNSFGQVRLVLKDRRYMIEATDITVLQRLLRDPIIGPLRVDVGQGLTKTAIPKANLVAIPGTKQASEVKNIAQNSQALAVEEADEEKMAPALDDDDEDDNEQVHSFEIAPETVQTVSKRCRAIDLPLTEEYDFRNDNVNADLDIDLKPATSVRPYQETALRKMFGNNRAKSGIIVLPCGAGKTLVGITAACTVRKGVIVLCTSAMSVGQWRSEFLKWSNINPTDVAVFTADNKNMFPGNTGIIITTYSMVTQTRARSHEAQQVMDFLENREWGLMLLDEVHVVPAAMFQRVTYSIKAHTKLGLTATLLREDDKINELNFLIGPKLYEANWQELSQQGHIAKVQCSEVWCPMSPEFYREYIGNKHVHRRTLLYAMNPYKVQACQFLIDYHEGRGDKIIVFSDNVYALEWYARKLRKPFIHGDTKNSERVQILENFQFNPLVSTIFLSKIGDTSLDLPEATCLIQISAHYGSRRQEAQRLGRILRAKRRNDEGFNAFFYSLVSKGTDEMFYSAKRQAFLVDQGYSFKVITHLEGMDEMEGLALKTEEEKRELLEEVLRLNPSNAELEDVKGDLFSSASNRKKARRRAGLLADFSGGRDMAYQEGGRKKDKNGGRSNVFAKLHRDHKRRKEAREVEIQEANQYKRAAGYR